ncbi:MAG: hypothetical protein IPO70_11080 [Bacteroidetes bacterium]|nr:hypothetical protein [Bacteroidota bacterium]MBP6412028.1 hypothetical protein [Bacteroidia bacterium]
MAFITAIICVMLVLYYIFIVIPENEANSDKYFASELKEMSRRCADAIIDYTNAVEDSVVLKKFRTSKGIDTAGTSFKNNIILSSISNTGISVTENFMKLSKSILVRYTQTRENKPVISTLTIEDTSKVNIQEFKSRIEGSSLFESYIFYLDNDPSKVLFSMGINRIQFDSLKTIKKGNKGIAFDFQQSRFYQHSFNIINSSQTISCYASINSKDFSSDTREFKPEKTIYSALLILLLVLSIPFIKPLISSQNEKIVQADIILVTSAIGVLAIVVAVFILQAVLNGSRMEDQKIVLERNAKKVETAFKKEFDFIEENIYYPNRSRLIEDEKKIEREYKQSPFKKYSIQNLFTMNSDGDLVKDLHDSNLKLRKNFNSRSYLTNHLRKGKQKLITAVYSRNSNKLVSLFTERNLTDEQLPFVTGVAYYPRFQKSIKLGLDCDYLICNKEGRVYFHSDSVKNLNENVLVNSRYDKNLYALFRGTIDNPYFTMDYDLKPTLAYATQLNPTSLSEPLFLISMKSLEFEQHLRLYAIINSFLIAIIYCGFIFLLSLVFSVLYFKNHIRTFSKQHLYWLFPNASKHKEFKFLTRLNYTFIILAIVLFALFPTFPYLITTGFVGILLMFIAFVTINVRKAKPLPIIFACLLSALIATFSFKFELQILLIILFSILPLIFYLVIVNKIYESKEDRWWSSFFLALKNVQFAFDADEKSGASHSNDKNVSELKILENKASQIAFTNFMTSVLASNFWVIAMLLFFFYYFTPNKELMKYEDINLKYTSASLFSTKPDSIQDKPYRAPLLDNEFEFGENPLFPILKKAEFIDEGQSSVEDEECIFSQTTFSYYIIILILFGISFFILRRLVHYYSLWFFFSDLTNFIKINTEVSKLKINNGFYNNQPASPPFSWPLIEIFINNEQKEADRKQGFDPIMYYSNCLVNNRGLKGIDFPTALELVMKENIEFYEKDYEKIWNALSASEQFVLQDFAADHFVSNKNKLLLAELIKKGLLIVDEETHRLRVMTLAFRLYVMEKEIKGDEIRIGTPPGEKSIELNSQGNFAKWSAPILIIALSLLMLLFYLNKDKVDSFVIIAGSLLSFLGILNKLFEVFSTPKQKGEAPSNKEK